MADTGPALFSSIQPTSYLYVSASAAAGGDGSQDNPFNTIQLAVNHAAAGTAIMVGAGEYHENVKLPSISPSTATAPIWLISADGQGAATVIAPSNSVAAIYGYGTDNYVVKDFSIEGGKNGIQFSQSGTNFANMVQNIVVQGNIIHNTAEDGIKIDQADNVEILGNTINTTGQEGVDFVAVNNSLVAYNDVSNSSGAAGIMIKGGSTSDLIDANNVHDIALLDGIEVGGWSTGDIYVPGYSGYEAKDITVINNEVHNVAKRPLNVLGAINSSISNNYLEANPAYYWAFNVGDGYPNAPVLEHSSNIEIANNIIANSMRADVSADSSNIFIHDNTLTGVWNTPTGPAAMPTGSGQYARNDTASYANAAAGVSVDLSIAGLQETVGAGSDQLVSVENLTGSAFADVLAGDGGDNVLSGGLGDDVLRGEAGNNLLDGGSGTDTAAYALAPSDYYVTANSDGGYLVQGPGETDTLSGIEQASFDATGQTLTLAQFAAQDFNPLQYTASNPDLIQYIGDNQTAALQHYLQHGYAEGRSINSFNPLEYIASNSDLLTGLGDNQTAALEHYIQHGYAEGRSTASFSALEYTASNPDLIPTVGDNQTAALEDYILHGYAAGRPTASFDALEYIASNTDLIQYIGDDQTAALEHYILHGYGEKRSTASFNVLEYLASNPDLIPSLSDNQTAALEEYIQQGYGQGRATTSFNVLEYVASNPDLAKAWGSTNTTAAYEHYILHGYGEGRSTGSFDAVAYLLSNPDLQNGYLTAQTAELHYLNHGVNEGRSASGAFGTEQTQHALTLGAQLSDTIATTGDEDWFSINLTVGQNYTLTLSGADSASGTLADPRLELHSATGALLASDNDSGPGKDALIHITASTTGTFYLVAASNSPTATGSYKILAAGG